MKIPKKKYKRRASNVSTTTSESGKISIHSDSDVLSDDFSDIQKEDFFRENSLKINKAEALQVKKNDYGNKVQNILTNNYAEERTIQADDTYTFDIDPPVKSSENCDEKQKITILSSVRFTPENCRFVGLETCKPLQLNEIDISFDVSESNDRKTTHQDILNKENTLTTSKQRKYTDKEGNEEDNWE